MSGHPDFGGGIAFRDVAVQVLSGPVVVALFSQGLDKAGGVAGVSGCHAVADLLPHILSALAAAAGAEEVVVDFVVACRLRAIEDGHGGAL